MLVLPLELENRSGLGPLLKLERRLEIGSLVEP